MGQVPFPRDPNSIWRCPCGYEDRYLRVVGHRKGYKGRPECDKGRIVQVSPGPSVPTAPTPPPRVESEPQASDEVEIIRPTAYEYRGEDEQVDPEELARRLNLSRQAIDQDTRPEFPPSDDGHGAGDIGVSLPEGDWRVEPPQGPPQVSQARETVSLPIIVRVMYDWARQQGWDQGDGSLSAFVADCMLDHFTHCWGKAIVVVDRSEVNIV